MNGTGYLQNYYQIERRNIDNGLQCVGESNNSMPSWIFPNGEVLNSYTLPLRAGVEALYTSEGYAMILYPRAVSDYGVYTCQVKDHIIDGTVTIKHIWIVSEKGIVCI